MEIIYKKQFLDLKTITELKNSIESFKNRHKQTEERINEIEVSHLKLSRVSKRKQDEKSGLMWYHQKRQYTFPDVPEEQKEKEKESII